MIVGQATQVVLGASLRAHVFPFSRQNPPPVELPAASFRPSPPSVIQEAALSRTEIKDPLSDAAEKYRYVLTLFTLIEDGANPTPQSRLERLSTFPLEERPPLMVCLEAP